MTYIDGFVLAVPNANKQKFIDHADQADPMFAEMGAKRIFECWGDDVPDGKVTDFKGAVQARRMTRASSSRGSNGPTRRPATPR